MRKFRNSATRYKLIAGTLYVSFAVLHVRANLKYAKSNRTIFFFLFSLEWVRMHRMCVVYWIFGFSSIKCIRMGLTLSEISHLVHIANVFTIFGMTFKARNAWIFSNFVYWVTCCAMWLRRYQWHIHCDGSVFDIFHLLEWIVCWAQRTLHSLLDSHRHSH